MKQVGTWRIEYRDRRVFLKAELFLLLLVIYLISFTYLSTKHSLVQGLNHYERRRLRTFHT